MLTLFEILLICALLIYALEFLFLRIGLAKANQITTNNTYEPTVTVIVAARNEEEYIETCLQSLVLLEYPKDKLEIIVIDDHSTDSTYDIIEKFAKQYFFVRCMEAEPEQDNLRGKTNAITQAIESSQSEILMFTDADCKVSTKWVKESVKYFDENTGIVGGYTVLDADSAFEGIQALDWIILFSTSSSTAGWNIPLTAIGNNLSVRRKAYNDTGGYRSIPFSVTEDYALVRAILEKTSFKLRFPIAPNSFVISKACTSIKQLFRQKQRWGMGGLDMITHGFIIFASTWMLCFTLLVGLLFTNVFLFTYVVLAKLIIDVIYVFTLLKKLKRISYIKYIFLFELYFSFYVLIIPFIALLSKKVVWKERQL